MAKKKGSILQSIDDRLAAAEAQLADLDEQVKAKKTEIRKLQKEKEAELCKFRPESHTCTGK